MNKFYYRIKISPMWCSTNSMTNQLVLFLFLLPAFMLFCISLKKKKLSVTEGLKSLVYFFVPDSTFFTLLIIKVYSRNVNSSRLFYFSFIVYRKYFNKLELKLNLFSFLSYLIYVFFFYNFSFRLFFIYFSNPSLKFYAFLVF